MKTDKQWIHLTHNPRLHIHGLHARFIHHAYPRHNHEYYVISVIARGRQSFMHKGALYKTSAGGVIFINPEVVHTGETVDEYGFELCSIYPTSANLQAILLDLTGRNHSAPFFTDVQVNSAWATNNVLFLHQALSSNMEILDVETRFLHIFGQLLKRHTNTPIAEQKIGNEKKAIQKARAYIEDRFLFGISLKELADYVALSPYYFLRTFRDEVGMPPYEYLENVRIHHAQRLISSGKPLAQIALETGFSSQSHMTRSFKKIIGVTPGQYAAHISPAKTMLGGKKYAY